MRRRCKETQPEDLTGAGCCSVTILREGVKRRESRKNNLPAESTVEIMVSGHITETAFLEWLQYLQKRRISDKVSTYQIEILIIVV
jgi:hypothetical protein